MKWLSLSLLALLTAACVAPSEAEEEDEAPSVSEDALTRTYSGVTLLWEGNWDFLVKCDSYSRRQNAVMFTCDERPSREFVDEGAWLAAPRSVFSRSICGKTAKVCKGTKCIDAKIMERSVTGAKWEGSTAVLEALGVEPGFTSCTRSWGSASGVTVSLDR